MIRRRIYFSILDPVYVRPGGTWWYRDFDPSMRRELGCHAQHLRPAVAQGGRGRG